MTYGSAHTTTLLVRASTHPTANRLRTALAAAPYALLFESRLNRQECLFFLDGALARGAGVGERELEVRAAV